MRDETAVAALLCPESRITGILSTDRRQPGRARHTAAMRPGDDCRVSGWLRSRP